MTGKIFRSALGASLTVLLAALLLTAAGTLAGNALLHYLFI